MTKTSKPAAFQKLTHQFSLLPVLFVIYLCYGKNWLGHIGRLNDVMLDFVFAIHSPILPIGVWFSSILIGLIISYFLMSSRKTLYRIPFTFLVSVLYFFYIVLTWLSTYLAITTSLTSLPPLIVLALLSMPSFLMGFFLMQLCVMRARDGFRSKRAAWLIIAPIFNLGLFIVTLDDSKNDPEPPITRDPICTAKEIRNILAT